MDRALSFARSNKRRRMLYLHSIHADHHTPKPYVRKAFEKHLECGIFARSFARARCCDCGHDFLLAFSCKGRGVCPSCTMRRMAETAAHRGSALHIGAVAFIHRFGSSLNEHVHFHICAVDGLFEEVACEGDADADAQARAQARAPGVRLGRGGRSGTGLRG
jgi:hypothetical protein